MSCNYVFSRGAKKYSKCGEPVELGTEKCRIHNISSSKEKIIKKGNYKCNNILPTTHRLCKNRDVVFHFGQDHYCSSCIELTGKKEMLGLK